MCSMLYLMLFYAVLATVLCCTLCCSMLYFSGFRLISATIRNIILFASCDSACKRPPFLASYRSLKNLKRKTQIVIDLCVIWVSKVIFLSSGDPAALLDIYFLSEICLLNVSQSRRTNLDFYRICGDALPLYYLILFSFATLGITA